MNGHSDCEQSLHVPFLLDIVIKSQNFIEACDSDTRAVVSVKAANQTLHMPQWWTVTPVSDTSQCEVKVRHEYTMMLPASEIVKLNKISTISLKCRAVLRHKKTG